MGRLIACRLFSSLGGSMGGFSGQWPMLPQRLPRPDPLNDLQGGLGGGLGGSNANQGLGIACSSSSPNGPLQPLGPLQFGRLGPAFDVQLPHGWPLLREAFLFIYHSRAQPAIVIVLVGLLLPLLGNRGRIGLPSFPSLFPAFRYSIVDRHVLRLSRHLSLCSLRIIPAFLSLSLRPSDTRPCAHLCHLDLALHCGDAIICRF